MRDEAVLSRRWLFNLSGAAILSSGLPAEPVHVQVAPSPELGTSAGAADGSAAISPAATAIADYVAKALDRALPTEVVARTKLHVLDTLAAIVSGRRLKAGELAARYVDSL